MNGEIIMSHGDFSVIEEEKVFKVIDADGYEIRRIRRIQEEAVSKKVWLSGFLAGYDAGFHRGHEVGCRRGKERLQGSLKDLLGIER